MADTLIRDKLELAVPATVVVAGALLLLPLVTKNGSLAKFPLAAEEVGGASKRREYFLKNAFAVQKAAYQKFNGAIYRLTGTDGDALMLPNKYLEELRKMPDTIIGTIEAQHAILQTHYTGMKADDPLMNHVIRSDLTHKLPEVNYKITEEVDRTVPEILGKSRDWTAINVNDSMLRMIAIISGHVFLGPELNREEAYLHASINYTVDVFLTAAQIRLWPKWLRFIGRYFVPGVDTIRDHRKRAKEFLIPVIQERKRLRSAGEPEPDDMLQWMIAKAEKFSDADDAHLAEVQLSLSLAAIHTTTMIVMHTLFDLTAHCPEVMDELRQEIRTVLAEHDGIPTTQALFQMKLLDSVMRESHRINPSAVTRFDRVVLQDVTFSDGTTVPKGTTISIPHVGNSFNPELFKDPYTYNPYRYRDLRAGAVEDPLHYNNKEQYQFISLGKEHMGFGYGRHACPGRFFAANEIKLVLSRMLLDYEIKMPDGETERYPNVWRGPAAAPDPTKSLMFKYVGA